MYHNNNNNNNNHSNNFTQNTSINNSNSNIQNQSGFPIANNNNASYYSSNTGNMGQNPITMGNQYLNPNNSQNPSYTEKDALFDIRKKIIGNNFINIVWLENPYLDFDPNVILSGAILMYIVIYPYSEKNYLIKFKFNKNSRIKIKEKLLNYFTDELLIRSEFLSQFLINKIILINLMIKYYLDNTNYKRIEIDLHFNNIPDPNPNKIYYETNLSLRNQIIKNIVSKNF